MSPDPCQTCQTPCEVTKRTEEMIDRCRQLQSLDPFDLEAFLKPKEKELRDLAEEVKATFAAHHLGPEPASVG